MRITATYILLVTLCFFFFQPENLFAQSWKQYPYQPDSSLLTFPKDEGRHASEPIEWWYTTAHLTGDSTGTQYSVMLTYFDYPFPPFDGFRIFNLANDDNGTFYPETEGVAYNQLADSGLSIQATTMSGNQESWVTLKDFTGDFVPFNYVINASSAHGSISLDYDAQKRPLILADSGFMYQGKDDYTYYYSQTHLDVSGTITFDGFTEPVSGMAWIDRQYGSFNPNTGEQYEWFSLQLDNGMDFNIWNIFTTDRHIPGNINYQVLSAWVNDSTQFTIPDFTLDRLAYKSTPDNEKVYSTKWRIQADTMDIDLVVEVLHPNQEVTLPFRFYEGATTISGTINGQPAGGKGFAELLHTYEAPNVEILKPTQALPSDSTTITWTLHNPDDGRPVQYDLWMKPYGSGNYQPIAQDLSDTSYTWFPGVQDSALLLRVVAHSVDSSLVGSYAVQLAPTGQSHFKQLEKDLKISPNPTNGRVLVQLPMEPIGPSVLRIYSENGRLVGQETVHGNKHVVNLSGLPDGMYIFEVGSDNFSFRGKVTKGE